MRTNTTALAGVSRSVRIGMSVLLACLALALCAPSALADQTFPAVRLYCAAHKVWVPPYEDIPGQWVFDLDDYVQVVLTVTEPPSGFPYTYEYEVTNHSKYGQLLSQFYFTSVEVAEDAFVADVNAHGGFVQTVGWGHWEQGTLVPGPAVKTLTGEVELWWRTFSAAPGYGQHASFGFTTSYDVSHAPPRDIGSAYVAVAYSSGADLLYGPDPNSSPGGQVPEWSSIMLGLIGFGGMGWRFRRLRYK